MVQLIAAQTVDRGDVVGYGTEYLGALANIKVNEENMPPCRRIKKTILITLMNANLQLHRLKFHSKGRCSSRVSETEACPYYMYCGCLVWQLRSSDVATVAFLAYVLRERRRTVDFLFEWREEQWRRRVGQGADLMSYHRT